MGGTLKPEFDANYPTKGWFLRYFEKQPPETKGPYDSRGCALDVQLTIPSWCEAPEFRHPTLVCAIEAVNRWRCRPCLLNHEPVEMETQISVIFPLFGE
jgi:hypothetical protein